MELQRILCPVDFSDLSALALRYSLMLTSCGDARITVAYADTFSPPPYFTESKLEALEHQFREAFRGAEAALSRFVKETLGAQAATGVGLRVVEALPADGIRRLALETKQDLIVMGTHGRSGINRLMLGSVAERVLREVEVPVLTVRGEMAKALDPPKSILVAVNNTPAARAALLMAAGLAGCFGGEVTALHVRENRPDRDIADLCAWMPEEARSHCTLKEVTREGDPAEQIVSLAREMPCDLLVIGAQPRRFFERTVLGSTTARVVRHSPCPVLTVNGK